MRRGSPDPAAVGGDVDGLAVVQRVVDGWGPCWGLRRSVRADSCTCNDIPIRRGRQALTTRTYTPRDAPHRDGDPVRDAPARGRVAAGARRGGRRRAVRRQAARRGARPQGAGRRAAGRRDRAPPRAARPGPGAGRARRRPRQGRAEPRDPGAARAVGRHEHRARLPARRARLRRRRRSRRPTRTSPRPIVWFDAYVTNVDRTPRNPNLIVWHRRLHLIDHGSALYIHHTWRDPASTRGARSSRSGTTCCCRSPRPSRTSTPAWRRWSRVRWSRGPGRRDPRRLAAGRGRPGRPRRRIGGPTSTTC